MKRTVSDIQRVNFGTMKRPSLTPRARDPRLPSRSWWTDPDFKAAHTRELPRILRSNASLMAPKMGEPVQS